MEATNSYKKWAEYFHALGFSVVPVGKDGDKKRPFVTTWKEWTESKQTPEELDNLDFSMATGIGCISGATPIIAIDIDGVTDHAFIDDFCNELGLDSKYEWSVLSGSGKGFHLWVSVQDFDIFSKDFEGEIKNVYTYNAKEEYQSQFDHIEIRVRQHTVLPPSTHPSGGRYEFISLNNGSPAPKDAPPKIEGEAVLKALTKYTEPKKKKSYSQTEKTPTSAVSGASRLVDIVEQSFDLVEFAKTYLPGGNYVTKESRGEIRVGQSKAGYGTILINPSKGQWNHPQSDFTGGGWAHMVAYHLTGDPGGYNPKDFPKYLKFAADFIGMSEEEQNRIKGEEIKAYYEANPKAHDAKYGNGVRVLEKTKEEAIVPFRPSKRGVKILGFKEWISLWYEIRFNEITQITEIDGEPLTDRKENQIYQLANEQGINISRQDVANVLNSDFVKGYNPLREFFETRQYDPNRPSQIHLLSQSVIQKTYTPSFWWTLLKKWMVGTVAGIYPGKKNILELVLYGDQRTGKTYFLRNILPIELLDYYAECKLDGGYDSEIAMCSALIIMDDEYGGKSKRESKVHKDLISKEKFTIRLKFAKRPVTLDRIASLCGTTNEPDILTDTTGNRRVIPVEVERRDYALFDKIDRVQLWLEAYHLLQKGFDYELTVEEIKALNDSTTSFERLSVEGEILTKYFFHPGETIPPGIYEEYLTASDILIYLQKSTGYNKISTAQLGKELNRIGFENNGGKARRVNGKLGRFYKIHKRPDVPSVGNSF